ncbi:MAG: helix-turn-helix transcriptional regulator [Smithellaceae bacterium]|nr:helix-turn-helix transcriptional regulator [Smithellaceae bacterium]
MERKDGLEIALQERIKELNCLYGMARLAESHGNSMEEFLKSLADFLPRSWRYEDVACARIVFRGETFESKKFAWTGWRQTAQIRVGGESAGDVTVLYAEERPEADEGPFLREERALLEAIAQRIGEIAVGVTARQDLQEYNRQLLLERKALQEANAALRVVLSNIEEEKRRIYENIQMNIDKVVMPVLSALAPAVPENKLTYLEILKTSLQEISSPFVERGGDLFRTLTPAEVDICNMIRNGMRSKEIARLRGVSEATVHRHREHIRRKFKIANEPVNLTAYLQSRLGTAKRRP